MQSTRAFEPASRPISADVSVLDVRLAGIKLSMEGRSGCPIELRNSGGHPCVRKYAKSDDYDVRLIAQAEKQRRFRAVQCGVYRFAAPRVLETGHHFGGRRWFDMEYARGSNYSEFLLAAPVGDLGAFADAMLAFLAHEISMSTFIDPPRAVIKEKLNMLLCDLEIRRLSTSFATKCINRLHNLIPDSPLPVGECHGDLTLSNMIVSDRTVYLLDFLDSFIETPIIDVAKLRQDTRFGWSVFIDQGIAPHQEIKLRQALQFLDGRLKKFIDDAGMQAWYEFFECMNLVRIIPYLNRETERGFIDDCLMSIDTFRVNC